MTHVQMPLRGAIFALAAFAAYACCDVMLKFLGQDMPSFQVMLVGAVFSVPFLMSQILWTEGVDLRPNLPGWMAVRVALTAVNVGFVTYTFTHLPLEQCYAIFFTMPLLITVFAWPLLGEKVDLLRGGLVALGFAGVLIALQPGQTDLQLGHLTALLGASLGATNSLILRKIGQREKRGAMLFYPLVGQIVVAVALMATYDWQPLTPRSYVAATVLGLLSTVGGLLMVTAYRIAPTIAVAPMQYSQILWASMLGYVLFMEAPSLITMIGIVIISTAGILLLVTAANQSPSGAKRA